MNVRVSPIRGSRSPKTKIIPTNKRYSVVEFTGLEQVQMQ